MAFYKIEEYDHQSLKKKYYFFENRGCQIKKSFFNKEDMLITVVASSSTGSLLSSVAGRKGPLCLSAVVCILQTYLPAGAGTASS